MELSQQKCILTRILNCGYTDLELLEDVYYDLDDIIDDLLANNCLNFNSLLRAVFCKGIEDLDDLYKERKDDILTEIKSKIHEAFDEYILDQKMDYDNLLNNEDYKQLLVDYQLIREDRINHCDYDIYTNYSDSHIFIANLEFYGRYLENEILQIEHDMGWTFEDKSY